LLIVGGGDGFDRPFLEEALEYEKPHIAGLTHVTTERESERLEEKRAKAKVDKEQYHEELRGKAAPVQMEEDIELSKATDDIHLMDGQ
jgi:hypothetical protein